VTEVAKNYTLGVLANRCNYAFLAHLGVYIHTDTHSLVAYSFWRAHLAHTETVRCAKQLSTPLCSTSVDTTALEQDTHDVCLAQL
jgi:hypothetical protein